MPSSAQIGRLSALACTLVLTALPSVAAADYESEYDPLDGMGRCTSVDNASAARVRTLIAETTAMVTICMQCDDVTPRRRDPRTLRIVPFNGGTLNQIYIDGDPIDLAQTFVKLDEAKFDDLHLRIYTSAPFKNLALLADCRTSGAPMLRGLHVEEPPAEMTRPPPAPSPPHQASPTTIVLQSDDHVLVAMMASLFTLLAAHLALVIRGLVHRRRALRARSFSRPSK